MKLLFAFALAACGGTDTPPLPAPIASVSGTLGALAVNDTSLFAIDTDSNTLLEIGLDGTVKPPLPTVGPIRELAATGNLVAWVETEGTGTVVKRRVAIGAIESQRTFDAHVIANSTGLYYSDLGLIAVWADAVPERIATPPITSNPRLLDVDGNFAYTTETDTSVVKYARMDTTSDILLPTSLTPAVKGGQLAYRTADGVRLRDLFTMFDRIVGALPSDYVCDPLIVTRAVMCGRFRALEGVADESLRDPVGGYAAAGDSVYWTTSANGSSDIRVFDAEAVTPE